MSTPWKQFNIGYNDTSAKRKIISEIGEEIRPLILKAEAYNLEFIAYLLKLVEIEVNDSLTLSSKGLPD